MKVPAERTGKNMKRISKKERASLTSVLRELGRRGGKASASALTPEQRRARAVKAGNASAAKRRESEALHA